MANLTQIELQNLRHLIGAHETKYQKLNTYASQAVESTNKANIHKISTRCFKHKAKTNVIFKYLSYGGYENG